MAIDIDKYPCSIAIKPMNGERNKRTVQIKISVPQSSFEHAALLERFKHYSSWETYLETSIKEVAASYFLEAERRMEDALKRGLSQPQTESAISGTKR